jgi:hypothetical protein
LVENLSWEQFQRADARCRGGSDGIKAQARFAANEGADEIRIELDPPKVTDGRCIALISHMDKTSRRCCYPIAPSIAPVSIGSSKDRPALAGPRRDR